MIDIQGLGDSRGIAIEDVGICGVRHVVRTGDRSASYSGVVDVALGVELPSERRGTHMSRLVELIAEHADDLTLEALPVVSKRLLAHLEAPGGRLTLSFPLVVDVAAPATGRVSQNVHDATLSVRRRGDVLELKARTEVIATSLCPCSKAISDYGAHNQRSRVGVCVAMKGDGAVTRMPTLRELVQWSEEACSSPTYPLLKRPDERHVTMEAYDHPVFVEDIVRDVALRMAHLEGPGSYDVRVVNEESIHRHDAYAALKAAI